MAQTPVGSGEGRKMDKLFNKGWFIKLSSIVIAVMLFFMVNMDGTPNQPGGLPTVTDSTNILEEVDLNVYYDDENYVLMDAPETVQVTLEGPKNVLTVAEITHPQQELYIDLTGKEAGTHYEQVKYREFPSNVDVSVNPAYVEVTIQERQTVSFPVDVQLENEGDIEDGHAIGTPTVEPSTVNITSAQGVLEQIDSARAIVDMAGRNTNFEDSVPVVLYDKDGNVLDVNADPPAVEVVVPVTSPNKEVPVRINRTGELPDGVAIESITTDPEVVNVFGPVDVINKISFIDGVTLDLSEIETAGEDSFEVDIPLPEGIESIDPETITVTVDVTVEQEREFTDFEIDVTGLGDAQSIDFIDPEEGTLDLLVSGSSEALNRLEREDLQVTLDVEGLEEGEHDVSLEFIGPQNLKFEQTGTSAIFTLSDGSTAVNNPSGEQEETDESIDSGSENENTDTDTGTGTNSDPSDDSDNKINTEIEMNGIEEEEITESEPEEETDSSSS